MQTFIRDTEDWDAQIKQELLEAGVTPITGVTCTNKMGYSTCGVLGGEYPPKKFEQYFQMNPPMFSPSSLWMKHPKFFRFVFQRDVDSWRVFGEVPLSAISHRHIIPIQKGSNQNAISVQVKTPQALKDFVHSVQYLV